MDSIQSFTDNIDCIFERNFGQIRAREFAHDQDALALLGSW